MMIISTSTQAIQTITWGRKTRAMEANNGTRCSAPGDDDGGSLSSLFSLSCYHHISSSSSGSSVLSTMALGVLLLWLVMIMNMTMIMKMHHHHHHDTININIKGSMYPVKAINGIHHHIIIIIIIIMISSIIMLPPGASRSRVPCIP